jgi:hypothetical protein
VLLKNLTATEAPFTSRSVSLAEDKRHKQLLGSAGSEPQYLLRMTTLLIADCACSSTSHHAFKSEVKVCEKVLLLPSMALDAAKLLLLLNVDD